MKKYDYIVAGQGIAGSVLALQLRERGKRVLVIDKPELSSSSKIAAGVYNPFNFRQMMNNWRAVEMVEAAKTLYRDAEKLSGKSIFTERKILKIFSSTPERILWEKACLEKSHLLADETILENPFGETVLAPYGIGVVNNGGSIDTAVFIETTRAALQADDCFLDEKFAHENLEITAEEITYDKRFSAGHIIFCEGHFATQNPLFSSVTIKPVKGELLHVHIPGLALHDVLNRGAYLLPLGNENFVLGSTFDNYAINEIPTEEGADDLLSRLEKFVKAPVTVLGHFAGIRPAVQDRRPVIGTHPQYKNVSMMNGMGSKAVLLSPWLGEQLLNHIEKQAVLPGEVTLARFFKR